MSPACESAQPASVIHCSKCGRQARQGDKFCSSCGEAFGHVRVSSEQVAASFRQSTIAWVVGGLLIICGFLAAFGHADSALIGPESFSGSQFAEARPFPYLNRGVTRPAPDLRFAYAIPLVGVAITGLGLVGATYHASRRIAAAVVTLAAFEAGLLLTAWSSFVDCYGSREMSPGIGTYACGIGVAVAAWGSWRVYASRADQG